MAETEPDIEVKAKNREELLKALEDLRKKLLDLTGHNPLLNFKHGRSTRYLRVVDELPDQVSSRLLDGKSMRFDAVPKPTAHQVEQWQAERGTSREPRADEWAERCGIRTDLEVPAETRHGAKGRHKDTKLQTLHFPDKLEARLGNIAKLARTTVEETGVNMLHLIVGFLEWYEDDSSDKLHQAPLIAIPVTLKKGKLQKATRTYQFELEYSGEDCQANVSLATRLKQGFDYDLPELPDELFAEEYLDLVARTVGKKFPRWKVRRFMTVAFLNFGKLLMYKDLDPEKWPRSNRLEENALVNAIVAGGKEPERGETGGSGGFFEEEYPIDEIDEIYDEFPIVEKADSSQHSALIDAVKGRQLVIEGPPGTGKSQTITNIIAAAMHAGKTVLFVSEKLAALEVVKQRLDRRDLGIFCLELHSHATQKTGVISALAERIKRRKRRFPAAYEDEIRRHRKLRNKLAAHAQRVNERWRETGMTIHGILTSTVRLAGEIPDELKDVLPPGTDTSGWTRLVLEEIQEEVAAFHQLVLKVRGEIGGAEIEAAHPWRGVSLAEPALVVQNGVSASLEHWNKDLQALARVWEAGKGIHGADGQTDDLDAVRRTPGEVRSLPQRGEGVCWSALPWAIQGGHRRLQRLSDDWDEIVGLVESTDPKTAVADLAGVNLSAQIESVDRLRQIGFAGSASLEDLLDLLPETQAAIALVQDVARYFQEYAGAVEGRPPAEADADHPTAEGLRRISTLLEHLEAVGADHFSERHPDWLDAETLEELQSATQYLKGIQEVRAGLSKEFNFSQVPSPEIVSQLALDLSDAGFFRRLIAPSYRRAKASVVSFLVQGKKGFRADSIVESLQNLFSHLSRCEAFATRIKDTPCYSGSEAWKGIESDVSILEALIGWHLWLFEGHCENTQTLFGTSKPDDFAKWQLECPAGDLEKITKLARVGYGDKVIEILGYLERTTALGPASCSPEAGGGKALVNVPDEDGELERITDALVDAGGLQGVPGIHPGLALEAVRERLSLLLQARRKLDEWLAAVNRLNSESFDGTLPGEVSGSPDAAAVLRATHAWGTILADFDPAAPTRLTYEKAPSQDACSRLRDWAEQLERALDDSGRSERAFEKASAGLRGETWYGTDSTLVGLIHRNRTALESPELLPGYVSVNLTRETLSGFGLGELACRIESNAYPAEMVSAACRHAHLQVLSSEILQETPELSKFVGARQDKVREKFCDLDEELMALTREKIASEVFRRFIPKGETGTRVRDYTEYELIKHETGKQRRHLPIRQLLARAGKAAQALKPCFMMGPRSVAQYLAPGGLRFDLLVIDEASQMKPADALGAAARVDQIVVVGDPKQLPPTSFFDRLSTGDDDEDEDRFAIGTSESILEALIPLFTTRQLRWHYRSVYESLIAFSNHYFYDNNLLLFPSAKREEASAAVTFHRVSDGCFANQVNAPEAKVVAERVMDLLCEEPKLSLGVATMSAKQRDYVERSIDELAKENPVFDRALSENRRHYEGLFIKNLESVQGDEREVILISCTYGPESVGGRVFQRFGPINSDVGWRRLNVLFTRSRRRMEVFSSMTAGDIIVDEASSRGVKSLKRFLQFAATGMLEVGEATGRPPDSDFEIAVAKLLAEDDYECDFQVGAAGFFIDLGVRHPQRPGEYIMGIECDGEAYHSAKSSRDRDKLRQEVLEQRGWRIRRIWSTDWYANPTSALAPILKELNAISSEVN